MMEEVELTREAFTELLVAELKAQGLDSVSPRLGQAPISASQSLISTHAWTAKKTYQELLLDQPRAARQGLDKLAQLICNVSLGLEKAEAWLVIDEKFVKSVVSLATKQQQEEAAGGAGNLARALFVDYVLGNSIALEHRLKVARQVPPGLLLPATALPQLASIVRALEEQHGGENEQIWSTYLEILRICLQNAVTATTSTHEFQDYVQTHFLSCLPTMGDVSERTHTFIQCFTGLYKHCEKRCDNMQAHVVALAPTMLTLMRREDCKANEMATCLGLLVHVRPGTDVARETLALACKDWAQQRFGGPNQDLFLENYLLSALWRDQQAARQHANQVRARALGSTSYSNVLWPLFFAQHVEEDGDLFTEFETRLGELRADARETHLFLAFLAKHSWLLEEIKRWRHVHVLLNKLQTVCPQVVQDAEVDKRAKLNFKLVMSTLRGKNID